MFTTDTKAKIIEFIRQNGSATTQQLQADTGISSRGISKHLKELKKSGKIIKTGKPKSYHLNNSIQNGTVDDPKSTETNTNTVAGAAKSTESSINGTVDIAKSTEIKPTVDEAVGIAVKGTKLSVKSTESIKNGTVDASKSTEIACKSTDSDAGAYEQSTAYAGPLQYWTAKLKVEPQLVENCHHEIYSWFFSFGRRVYNEPIGLGGKAIDSFIWILALGLSWIWKIFCIASSQVRLSRVFLFLFMVASIVVGIVVWRSHHVEQTGEYLNLGGRRLALEQELSQARAENVDLRSQLAQAKEQIKALKADNEDLNHHVLKSMDESSKLGVENLSLKEQLDKAQKSSEGLGQKIKNKIFNMF